MGSTWSLEGDVLVVPAPAMTAMACEPAALMDQDTWLAAVLTSRPTVALDGDTLTLTAEGTVVTLVDRETANPDRPLEGTTWNLESIVTGDAVSSLPASAGTPTLRFEGGQLALDTGCNTGSGGYTVADTDITIGPIALTRRACLDQPFVDVEQRDAHRPHRHGGLGDRGRRPDAHERRQRSRPAGGPGGRDHARGTGRDAVVARLDRRPARRRQPSLPACDARHCSSMPAR